MFVTMAIHFLSQMGSSLMVIMLSGQSIGSKGEIPVDMLLRGW